MPHEHKIIRLRWTDPDTMNERLNAELVPDPAIGPHFHVIACSQDSRELTVIAVRDWPADIEQKMLNDVQERDG